MKASSLNSSPSTSSTQLVSNLSRTASSSLSGTSQAPVVSAQKSKLVSLRSLYPSIRSTTSGRYVHLLDKKSGTRKQVDGYFRMLAKSFADDKANHAKEYKQALFRAIECSQSNLRFESQEAHLQHLDVVDKQVKVSELANHDLFNFDPDNHCWTLKPDFTIEEMLQSVFESDLQGKKFYFDDAEYCQLIQVYALALVGLVDLKERSFSLSPHDCTSVPLVALVSRYSPDEPFTTENKILDCVSESELFRSLPVGSRITFARADAYSEHAHELINCIKLSNDSVAQMGLGRAKCTRILTLNELNAMLYPKFSKGIAYLSEVAIFRTPESDRVFQNIWPDPGRQVQFC